MHDINRAARLLISMVERGRHCIKKLPKLDSGQHQYLESIVNMNGGCLSDCVFRLALSRGAQSERARLLPQIKGQCCTQSVPALRKETKAAVRLKLTAEDSRRTSSAMLPRSTMIST